jgi:ribosome-binding ATPase YchF (GTP1/OBG family)
VKIAVTGKPFVGKSTIFKAITRASEDHHLIDKPNVGIVKVPDERL